MTVVLGLFLWSVSQSVIDVVTCKTVEGNFSVTSSGAFEFEFVCANDTYINGHY